MIIKKALITDLEKIHLITKNCATHLIENNIFQWNEQYPSKEIIKTDIKFQELWKLEENKVIKGFIVLTETEDLAYKNVKWLTKNYKNLYIHRLAVAPSFQGKGYAQKLMNFAEHYAITNKYHSIRLDTFSQNKRNQKFYELRNYVKLENIYFPKQSNEPFYCYELILDV